MRTPKRLIPFLLVPAVIGATIFTGVAAAQNSGGSGQNSNTPAATAKLRPAGKIQDVLAKLVADGAITQAQADKILEAMQQALERPMPKPHFDLGIRNITNTVAKALSMEPEALVQEFKDGKTLQQIIAAHGSTVDKVVAALVAPVKERLDKLVADGKLTQAQADEQLAKFQENVKKHVENFKLPALQREKDDDDKQELRGRGKGDRPAPGIGRGPRTDHPQGPRVTPTPAPSTTGTTV